MMDIVSWIAPQMEGSISRVPLQGNDADDARLRKACHDFESVLTSTMLKEGLRASMTPWDEDGDSDQASKGYTEMVQTQMAGFLGKQGVMGIADTLYDQLKGLESLPRKE